MELEAVSRDRQQARLEWDCLQRRQAKTDLNRLGRRQAKLRKRQRRLLQLQAAPSIASASQPDPPTSQPIATPRQPTVSPAEPRRQRDVPGGLDVPVLLRSLREAIALAGSKEAALLALDAVLAALPSHLVVEPSNV